MFSAIRSGTCSVLSALIAFLGSAGLWKPQMETLQTIQKVTDGFYTMDYCYDYDFEKMLEYGNSTTVGLFAYGLGNVFLKPVNFGCTTFNAQTPGGDALLARNFDYMDSPMMLVWTHPKNGYKSVSMVSLYFFLYNNDWNLPEDEASSLLTLLAPYAPLDGMNEKGLSIGVLELEKDPLFQISCRKNLTTTTMIRACLDTAATVDEAIAIFESHDLRDLLLAHCTYHYQIADATGKSVVIEYVDGKMNVIEPEKRDAGIDWITAANYYLTEGVDDPMGMGWERTDIVKENLGPANGIITEKKAMNILQKCSMKDADLHGYICSTLWSSVYNMDDLTFDLCVNTGYDRVYSFSLDEPQAVH